jgi:hypothetical protein
VAEALLDAIGFVPAPADAAERQQPNVHRLQLTPVWTIEDPELRQLGARAVSEARCGRLWFCRRPVTLQGRRSCWLETVVLAEDGVPLERGEVLKLPWREVHRQAHAAVLIDMATQVPVRCLWRGLPDLPKGLKLTAAAKILEEIERRPGR